MKNVTVGGVRMVGFRAGYYAGAYRGHQVAVENTVTHYGDKGWLALVDDECVTDYPRYTRAEAVAVALTTINAKEAR